MSLQAFNSAGIDQLFQQKPVTNRKKGFSRTLPILSIALELIKNRSRDLSLEEELKKLGRSGKVFRKNLYIGIFFIVLLLAAYSVVVADYPEAAEAVDPDDIPLVAEELELDPTEVDDGTYEGTGRGFADDVVVEVTVSDGEITGIVIVSHGDTPDYFQRAEAEMPDRIIQAQSIDVDVVSGATASSVGILEAVSDALK